MSLQGVEFGSMKHRERRGRPVRLPAPATPDANTSHPNPKPPLGAGLFPPSPTPPPPAKKRRGRPNWEPTNRPQMQNQRSHGIFSWEIPRRGEGEEDTNATTTATTISPQHQFPLFKIFIQASQAPSHSACLVSLATTRFGFNVTIISTNPS